MIVVLKFIIDIFLLVFVLMFVRDLRSITDLIPNIQLSIYNISFTDYYHFIFVSLIFFIWRGFHYGLYSFKPFLNIFYELSSVFKSVTMWIIMIVAYLYFAQNFLYTVPIPRLILIYSYVLLLIGFSFYRILIWVLFNYLKIVGYARIKVLFIGSNELSNKVYSDIKKNKIFKVIGSVEKDIRSVKRNEVKIIGLLDDLEKIIDKYNIDELIFTMEKLSKEEIIQIIDICQIKHVRFRFIPDILNIYNKNIEIVNIAGMPIISLKNTPLDGWGYVIKSIFDRIVTFILIIVFSPVFLLIAVAIKLDSRGPVFFAYDDNGKPLLRVGRNKKPFHYFKFRSMYDKVHSQEKILKNEREDGPMFKIKNDPRITRVGKILRKTHLDELAELFLVFKGDMSLVGPRPHWISEVERYKKHYNKVFEIKPGMTGLSQVVAYGDRTGSQDLLFEDEVKIDVQYMQTWSLWLDIYILIKTFSYVVVKAFINKK